MSEPQHISETLPSILADIDRRRQEQARHRDRVFNALADFQRRSRPALLKTRSGEGEHLRLAYRFETGKHEQDIGALTLRELGILVKTKKG